MSVQRFAFGFSGKWSSLKTPDVSSHVCANHDWTRSCIKPWLNLLNAFDFLRLKLLSSMEDSSYLRLRKQPRSCEYRMDLRLFLAVLFPHLVVKVSQGSPSDGDRTAVGSGGFLLRRGLVYHLLAICWVGTLHFEFEPPSRRNTVIWRKLYDQLDKLASCDFVEYKGRLEWSYRSDRKRVFLHTRRFVVHKTCTTS